VIGEKSVGDFTERQRDRVTELRRDRGNCFRFGIRNSCGFGRGRVRESGEMSGVLELEMVPIGTLFLLICNELRVKKDGSCRVSVCVYG